MIPVLLELGPLKLRAYGVMVAIAFIVGLRLAMAGGRKRGLPDQFVLDWAALSAVSGILGARVMYALLNWSYFSQNPFDFFKIWEGGLVFYGGFLAAAGA